MRLILLLLVIFSAAVELTESYFESVATSVTGGVADAPVVQSEPFSALVAFQCGYRNRYFTKDGGGAWVTDNDPRAGCLKGKLDILKYCRKVYPNLRITNIVESSHDYEIPSWCKLEGHPCKWTFNVKPYRCVVGSFESEALLVPERCHFGHVDDQRVCKDFDHWNQTARTECEKWNAQFGVLKSFAMLEPCGLDMFSGVEFVCCPKGISEIAAEKIENGSLDQPSIDLKVKVKLSHDQTKSNDDEDESSEEYEDEDSDDSEDDDDDETVEKVNAAQSVKKRILTTTMSTSKETTVGTTTGSKSTVSKEPESEEDGSESDDTDNDSKSEDPYFRVADPDREYSAYRLALDRLEKRHREKVTEALRKLSDAETKYQKNMDHDAGHVEAMKAEFQRTMGSLEKVHHDERHRIEEVHEARVIITINERKRQAIQAYREVLSPSDGQPRARTVLRALQAYIKAEEKDRVHGLNRYRYLLRSDSEEANTVKEGLLKKFRDIDLRVNGSIAMMNDIPGLAEKVKPAALEFWQRFRSENTPGRVDESLTWIGDHENAERLLEMYKKLYDDGYRKDFDKSRSREDVQSTNGKQAFNNEESDIRASVAQPAVLYGEKWGAKKEGHVEHEDVKQSHSFALKETLQHAAVVREEVSVQAADGHHYGYVVLAVVGITMLVAVVLGIAVFRRRCSTRADGFVAVDAMTPEERHMSGMQVNGYENPTYTYFEAKVA